MDEAADQSESEGEAMPFINVLSIGQDPVLLVTRSLFLRAAGYGVEGACNLKEALLKVRDGDFDVVILCHTIPTQDRNRLISLIRASGSRVPVIYVELTPQLFPSAFADATVEGDPTKLLTCIRETLESKRRIFYAGMKPKRRVQASANARVDKR